MLKRYKNLFGCIDMNYMYFDLSLDIFDWLPSKSTTFRNTRVAFLSVE